MYPRLSANRANLLNHISLRLVILLLAITLICIFAGSVQAQRGAPRDIVRAIERKELDRMLLLKVLPSNKDTPERRAALKQIAEDFRDMQGLNNKMMADAWSREELDYKYISDTVSQIRGKATRLKTTLSLPELEQEPNKASEIEIAGARQFRSELLQLDRLIMSFVTNPMFQKANVVEVDLANKASRDLCGIIDQSAKLKKTAAKLQKSPKT